MGPDPRLQLLLDRLARALLKHEEAERALMAAAQRVAGGGAVPAPAELALQRAEVLERRARLHVEIARGALARHRQAFLDDQRRVPAAFRRVPERHAGTVEMVGTRAQPAARPPRQAPAPIALPPRGAGEAPPRRPHDLAAS